MSWTSKSGNRYYLCLLDTNAISDILKNENEESNTFIERFPPTDFVPCFSFYNIIELRRKRSIYNKFLDFFSIYPIFFIKSQSMIFTEELNVYDSNSNINILFNAFSPLEKNDSYDLRIFIETLFLNSELKALELNHLDIICLILSNKSSLVIIMYIFNRI